MRLLLFLINIVIINNTWLKWQVLKNAVATCLMIRTEVGRAEVSREVAPRLQLALLVGDNRGRVQAQVFRVQVQIRVVEALGEIRSGSGATSAYTSAMISKLLVAHHQFFASINSQWPWNVPSPIYFLQHKVADASVNVKKKNLRNLESVSQQATKALSPL